MSSTANPKFMKACAEGRSEEVRQFLNSGGSISGYDEHGRTPLMVAASYGNVQVAKILLEFGVRINIYTDESMETALTLSCRQGHLEMVRFLLSAGANKDQKTYEKHTALMEAIVGGHVEVVRLLLDAGMSVNLANDCLESPLGLAAYTGHTDIALLLIERGANIGEVNFDGRSPIMIAASKGHNDMLSLLLRYGADMNALLGWTEESALGLACQGGYLETAKFLIRNGALLDLGEITPLMQAAQKGNFDIVKYLVECGANIHAQTRSADTALTYALGNGHRDVAVWLYNS